MLEQGHHSSKEKLSKVIFYEMLHKLVDVSITFTSISLMDTINALQFLSPELKLVAILQPSSCGMNYTNQ